MRRSPRPAVALVVSLLGTLALFGTAELGVRLAGVEPAEFATAAKPEGFDGMRVHPLLGPLPKPGWSGSWMGAFTAEIDAHGFRTAGAAARHPGARRVIFMGDSCTFGWRVDTPDMFLTRLETLQSATGSPPFELLDAAYPGHSAVSGAYMLREVVVPLQPDIVVLGFSANNAFRLATESDVQRFRWFGVRKAVQRSRVLHIIAAWLSNRSAVAPNPRDRDAIRTLPVHDLQRVAAAGDFEIALSTLVTDAQAAGAAVLFLVFPRAAGVSTAFRREDAAASVRKTPLPPRAADGVPTARERGLLEVSCLDPRQSGDPIADLRAQVGQWQPVYPDDPEVRGDLKRGALDYVRGDFSAAASAFASALARQPDSPLAQYDSGVAALAGGDASEGLRRLAEADRLACNVFFRYQVIVWRVATAFGVPVVDLTLWFQAHDGEELFLDPAHPNPAGHAIIAEALWPALRGLRRPSGPDERAVRP